MAADVLPLFDRIARYLRTLRATNLVQAAIAATVLPFVLVYASQYRALLVVVFVVYGWRKIRQFMRTDLSMKQIRLDERFYRQQMDGPTLRRCARRSDHLWDDSLALRAVRSIIARPPPRILSVEEKVGRHTRQFRKHFAPLVPRIFSPEALLPVALLVWLVVYASTAITPLWMSAAISALLIVCALEALQIRIVRRARVPVDLAMQLLGSWTFDLLGDESEAAMSTAYRHELLYRADPVYSAGIATHPSNDDDDQGPRD